MITIIGRINNYDYNLSNKCTIAYDYMVCHLFSLRLMTISCLNSVSDNRHLPGQKTLPATEKRLSTGALEAGIDKYNQARLANCGCLLCWDCQ